MAICSGLMGCAREKKLAIITAVNNRLFEAFAAVFGIAVLLGKFAAAPLLTGNHYEYISLLRKDGTPGWISLL